MKPKIWPILISGKTRSCSLNLTSSKKKEKIQNQNPKKPLEATQNPLVLGNALCYLDDGGLSFKKLIFWELPRLSPFLLPVTRLQFTNLS